MLEQKPQLSGSEVAQEIKPATAEDTPIDSSISQNTQVPESIATPASTSQFRNEETLHKAPQASYDIPQQIEPIDSSKLEKQILNAQTGQEIATFKEVTDELSRLLAQ